MYTFLLMIVSEDNKWFPSRNQAYILARMAGKVCLPVRVEKLLTKKKKKKHFVEQSLLLLYVCQSRICDIGKHAPSVATSGNATVHVTPWSLQIGANCAYI